MRSSHRFAVIILLSNLRNLTSTIRKQHSSNSFSNLSVSSNIECLKHLKLSGISTYVIHRLRVAIRIHLEGFCLLTTFPIVNYHFSITGVTHSSAFKDQGTLQRTSLKTKLYAQLFSIIIQSVENLC